MTSSEHFSSDQEPQVRSAQNGTAYEPWLEAFLTVAGHYRLDYSEEHVRLQASWAQGKPQAEVLRAMARQLGMVLSTGGALDATQLSSWRLPLVVQLRDGQVAVLETIGSDGNVGVLFSGDQGLRSSITREQLLQDVSHHLILRPARAVADARVDEYIKPYEPHWFRKIVLRDLKPYGHVMLASLMANLLALGGILFTRQVYDRVIPAESMATLYVLFSGVLVALLFEFILRSMRVRITDLLGKRADMRTSDKVFGHALRIRSSDQPRSTGSFIAQLRELEHVRELLTSSTVTACADLPFFALFSLLLWYLAGPLVLVPMVALAALVVPGILAQRKLRELAGEAMRESALRNAMLVETIQGLEDIRALQAENRFQQQWNHYNAVTADVNLKLRYIANNLGVWTHNVQTAVFSCVVLFGAPMVMAGSLSVGSLVAASILASRMMAPMSQITGVMSRWQQAKVAMQSLDSIMERRVENPANERRVHRAAISGKYRFRRASFGYVGAKSPSLQIKSLDIAPGERIAILGRNGAGKSTLLQALAGNLHASSGDALLDDVAMHHLDMADVRRDVGLMTQNARLFHGSIRENLLLGAPNATDDEILPVLAMSGADFIKRLPDGLDYMIQEGGHGLSGGQRQSLLLARMLLRRPQVLLLDEPSAALDEATEKCLIEQLRGWLGDRTLIMATHRMSMLALVDRIIVVDQGEIVVDGQKGKVLSQLARSNVKPVQRVTA
jgi:ATP-binding cassette subfamily C protein LapB